MARSKDRKSENEIVKGQHSVLIWILIIVVLLVFVGFFTVDSHGYPLRLITGFYWTLAFVGTFVAGLLYYALYLVPDRWTEGMRIVFYELRQGLKDSLSAGISRFSKKPDNLRQQVKARKKTSPLNKLPSSFKTMKVGTIESHQVLALTKENKFSRAIGPGFIRLQPGETILSVLDLRPHLCTEVVEVSTKDSIRLKVEVSVLFSIQRGEQEGTEFGLPYPYEQEAVFRASYAGIISEKATPLPWEKRIIPEAAAAVISHLSRYTLDEMYDPNGAASNSEITLKIQYELAERFTQYGVNIIRVDIGQFEVDPQISQQRIDNWQIRWQRDLDVARTRSNTEAYVKRNQAKAKGQMELINKIIDKVAVLQEENDVSLDEVFAMQAMQVMEEAILEEVGNSRVSSDILRSLARMVNIIDQAPSASPASPDSPDFAPSPATTDSPDRSNPSDPTIPPVSSAAPTE